MENTPLKLEQLKTALVSFGISWEGAEGNVRKAQEEKKAISGA